MKNILKIFFISLFTLCLSKAGYSQESNCLYKNPLCFYNTDILNYLQILHKNQQYSKMTNFLYGPNIDGKNNIEESLSNASFGYSASSKSNCPKKQTIKNKQNMKMKNLLMTTIAIFGLATFTFGQTLPSYVPSNGLLGWWPFNGNANDESDNLNNGTVNGATLTTDRFGEANAAYFFDPSFSQSNITINTNPINTYFTISIWAKPNRSVNFITESSACPGTVTVPMANSNQNWAYVPTSMNIGTGISVGNNGVLIAEHSPNLLVCRMNYQTPINNYSHIVVTYENDSTKLYLNGVLVKSKPTLCASTHNLALVHSLGASLYSPSFSGNLDDFGIWNRALTQQEITSLYSSTSIGINEVSQLNSFSVFPNPAQNIVNVNIDDKLVGSVFTIYDNIGKAVKTGKLNSANSTIELDDLSGGIYLFSVGENLQQTFKIIKE